MTIYSARERLNEIDMRGHCMPLAIDSIMHRTALPVEWYGRIKQERDSPDCSHNATMSQLLREFFGVEPDMSEQAAPLAKFTAFSGNSQLYFPDVPYEYPAMLVNFEQFFREHPENEKITNKHLRLIELLNQARSLGCLVLAIVKGKDDGAHSIGLDQIDPGHIEGAQRYVVRDYAEVASDKIYSVADLSGYNTCVSGARDNFAPLPEISKPSFPEGKTSWELIILPPEPTNSQV